MAAIRKSSSTWLGIFRRDFSAAAAAPASKRPAAEAAGGASAAAADSGGASTRRRRKKNLVEVAQFLPNWGVGQKLAKGHWQQGVFYQLTRLQLGKDGRHGTAWGIFHDSGAPKTGVEERIGGVNKRVWRYLTDEKNQTKKT